MTSHYENFDYGPRRPEATDGDQSPPGLITRRRILQGLLAGGAVGYGAWRGLFDNPAVPVSDFASARVDTSVLEIAPPTGGEVQTLTANVDDLWSKFAASDNVLLTPAPIDQRVLVIVELQGGNDGLSTVVPYANGAYYDRRPNLAIPGEQVLAIDGEVGLNPQLVNLAQRQMAVVEGVGPTEGNLSHFEMEERWYFGAPNGAGSRRTGFLARIADRIDGGRITGLSVAGHSPMFSAATASTLALDNLNQLKVLTKNDWIYPLYRSGVQSITGGPVATTLAGTWSELFAIGRSISGDIERHDGDSAIVKNGGRLGRQLAMAAELIKADIGVRVVHAQIGGFDTHEGHRGRHERLMGQLNGAIGGFLDLIDQAGLSDRVLVATTSEFGRRVNENSSGLDHGSASSMLLIGPVAPGRYGEPSPLGDLDRNGNLKTTVPFERYLATLAQDWLGVEAGAVLDTSPMPLGLFQI